MQPVHSADELSEGLATARRVALAAFGDDTLLLEQLVTNPRHIEVQLLADTHGNVIHLGERECSLQRRHQKVIEEAPSPLLSPQTRARIGAAACTVAASVGYAGAGTVEFLVSDDAPDEFFFMEMNTRLQVEHPVTELVTGIDLVAWQLWIAAGEPLTLTQTDIEMSGHAIEARVYAEDPEHGFLPSTGRILALQEPSGTGIRVDSALIDGLVISPDYDPMLAKIIAWGESRQVALERLDTALASTEVLGVRTNIEYLRALLADPDVQAGRLDTTLIERRLPELAFRHPDNPMLAAAARCLDGEREVQCTPDLCGPNHPGPWQSARGWRIGGVPAAIRFRFASSAGGRVDVYTMGDSVTIDGEKVESHGVWACAHDGETLWMGQDGFSWPLRIVDRDTEIRELRQTIEQVEHPRSPEVRSPMPGTVVAVAVKEGDVVEAGETIVTVEAMKMEHKLTASVAGRVSVAVHQGDAVKLDQVLARIEQISEERAP